MNKGCIKLTLTSLPSKFVTTMQTCFGDAGEALLRELPRLVSECKSRWELELFDHFPNLSYNYVVPGKRRDGTDIVLKIGVPSNKELVTEAESLRLFDGKGMVRLIDAVPEKGALLLERVLPGVPLTKENHDDETSTRIAAQVIMQLLPAVPKMRPFPSVAQWFEGLRRLRNRFGGGSGPFPEHLVAQAESLSSQLLSSSPKEVVLHGDFHHDNILSSDRGEWLGIDPKGVRGEPCYEAGAFIRNPIELFADRDIAIATVERRLRIFSEVCGFERERMVSWAVAQAVLADYWTMEDSNGHDVDFTMSCAETLSHLL